MAKDRWQELCKAVAQDDGLPVRPAGPWTQAKLYFWNRYLEMATTSMVGKPAWSAGLCYVDLFAGPGVCQLKESGYRFPGSPLLAANTPKPFSRIILVEQDAALANACRERISRTDASKRTRVLCGDCNQIIDDVTAHLPPRALTIAFIDPEALDAKFETIRRLTQGRRVDLLMLFADAYDIARNVEVYRKDPNSKLDQVLGPDSNWREEWDRLGEQAGSKGREMFARVYEKQLRKHLGYEEFDYYPIRSGRGPLYRLIYASKSTVGLKFWREVVKKDVTGQTGLFG